MVSIYGNYFACMTQVYLCLMPLASLIFAKRINVHSLAFARYLIFTGKTPRGLNLKFSFFLTRIIHGISFMQMRGVETRRNTLVFQGFCNEADA